MTDVKGDTGELYAYLRAGWQLIPLHRYDYKDEYKGKKRERGKSPRDGNWTRRKYSSKDQIGHMEAGNNVGVRLRACDLVLDVDPRNFDDGDDPLSRLCEDVGLDPELYPTVETGSGGLHIYMTKPEDVPVVDTLKGYNGLEFKTLGRQVVSAGSIHPSTLNLYSWDFLRPNLREVTPAPQRLLNIIRRPSRALTTGGGEHTQEEVAQMLDALDPEEFRDHDAWLTLMQACHHASNGDARSEFIEWSTRDPDYTDDGGIIGRRWDSLHADNEGGSRVTYRTLHKLMRDHDQADAVPRAPAEDDFEDEVEIPEMDDLPEHERMGPLERVNHTTWAVNHNGKFRIFFEEKDPTTDPVRTYWVSMGLTDYKNLMANQKIQSGKKVIPLVDAWMEWPRRRTARGVIFDPERDHEGFLNLWTGWAVQPVKKAGGWSHLDELLLDVLCDGDEKVYEYVLNWAAHMVQKPKTPAEVAVCFQGGQGVGKGTFGRALNAIAGRHGMPITSSDKLTGRFNAHLRDVIFLFADEAIKPYDKEGESRLKGLITEPLLTFEGKGKDAETGLNMLHVLMASNEDWFIPMSMADDRRFLVAKANTKWQGRHDKFTALNKQLYGEGGLEALLFDLLNRDIDGWSPRDHIPATKAAVDQKLRNMGPVQAWWFSLLEEGAMEEMPWPDAMCPAEDWAEGDVRVFGDDMWDSFEAYCREGNIRAGGSNRSLRMMFNKEWKKVCPGLVDKVKVSVPEDRPEVKPYTDGKRWGYQVPSLEECRKAFERVIGDELEWSENTKASLGF